MRALRLLDDVKTLVTVGENDLRVTAIFDVTVVQGTTATLAVRLPDGFSLTSFTGAPNEGADVVDGRLVLNVPAGRTRHQFLVALERPIVDAGSRRVVALPWLEGSQRETGDVAVEGVGALELAVAEQRPLTRIDVVELSAALTALAHEPLLAAYRYQRRGGGAGDAGVRRHALPGRRRPRRGRRSRDRDDAGHAGGAVADRGVADRAQPGAAVPARRAAGRGDAAVGGSRRRRGQAGARARTACASRCCVRASGRRGRMPSRSSISTPARRSRRRATPA